MSRLLLLAGAALLLLPVPPAAASCAFSGLMDLERSPEVVVARLVEQRDQRALLAVEEVWRGADRPPRLWVSTSPAGPGETSSVDAALVGGQRYVVRLNGDGPDITSCSVTAVQEADLAAVRPADARAPVVGAAQGDADPERPGWLAAVTGDPERPGWPAAATAAASLALAGAVLGGGLTLRRRRRRTGQRQPG